jgi:hypothetical protein
VEFAVDELERWLALTRRADEKRQAGSGLAEILREILHHSGQFRVSTLRSAGHHYVNNGLPPGFRMVLVKRGTETVATHADAFYQNFAIAVRQLVFIPSLA